MDDDAREYASLRPEKKGEGVCDDGTIIVIVSYSREGSYYGVRWDGCESRNDDCLRREEASHYERDTIVICSAKTSLVSLIGLSPFPVG